MMRIFQFSICVLFLFCVESQREGELQIRENSESRRITDRVGSPVFIFIRRLLWRATGSTKDLAEENRKDGSTQENLLAQRPDYKEFPCDPKGPGGRSKTVPTKVWKVRPGDIDIIGALGDSLSAGNGGYSNQILHIPMEFRSIAWSGGARGYYRQYLTLPNILKLFNPNIYGGATSDGTSIEKGAKLNLAEPMVMSADLVYQARSLINRMRKDPKVDFENHWKMITIFVGNNDFCSDSCHYKSYNEWVDLHAIELIKSLRIFRDSVPRLIINMVGLPDFTNLFKTTNSPLRCYAIYRVGCHCLFLPNMSYKKLEFVKKGIDLWNDIDRSIVNMEEFHTDNFTVIFQPFMTKVNFFKDEKRGIADFSYMANDCFHFSQMGHAMAALGIWQNLIEPDGNKTCEWNPRMNKVLQINCPTAEFPYIRVPNINISD